MSETKTAAPVSAAAKLVRVRQASIGLVFMLIIQFLLGIIFNLYGTMPASGHSFGLFSNGWLIVHEIWSLALLAASIQLVVRAMGTDSRLAKTTCWLGLLGIVLAMGAGIGFTRNSNSGNSLGMSIAFVLALVSYVINLVRLPAGD